MKMSKTLMNVLRLAAVGVALFFGTQAHAQSVSGWVVDASGQPVIGATVVVDGTQNGAATGMDGEFTLRAPAGSPVTVTILGYKDAKATLSPGMVITLEEDNELLEEVVVVGYGTVKKESLSGSVAVVKEEMLQEKGALTSPVQALQGQVPGVIITRASSAPGDESWSMSLRGAVSANNAEPLVIIDGVAYDSVNALRLLNSDDIASMSFLKDGAAAIYGSRAAGGVVLITTKKGTAGKVKINYNGSVTMKTVGRLPSLMTLDEWADSVLTALENDNNTSSVWYYYAQLAKQYKGGYIDLHNQPSPFGTTAFTDVDDFVFDDKVDWFGSVFGPAYSTNHDLSASGGTEASAYRISLGYAYDGSPLQYGRNNNQRYNIRLNNTFKLASWLTLDSSIGYNRQEQVAPVDVGALLSTTVPMPGLPLFTQDGKAYRWGTWNSPAAQAEFGGDNKLSVSAFMLSETLKLRLTSWLDGNVNLGYNTDTALRNKDNHSVEYYNYVGTKMLALNPTAANSYYEQTSSRTDFYSATAYLNAHKLFADAHNTSLTLGTQYEFKDYRYFGAHAKNIQTGLEVVNGSGDITLVSPNRWQFAVASFFGRANYDYKSRYLVELNARYDGSSKFLPQNRWAFFWGGSLAWRIAQEPFLKDVEWLDEFKLRASYGEVGNQSGIANYDGVQLYNTAASTGALVGNGLLSTVTTNGSFASTSRTWERIKNYNVGLDFGFFGNRLTGTLETFLKKNDNMLVSLDFPTILGDTAPKANSGKFKAWGYEGQIGWRDQVNRDFSYQLGGTFTFARNQLIDLGGQATVVNNQFVSNREGYPLNSLFGLQYGGKIETESQRTAYLEKYYPNNGVGMPSELRLGDNMFVDQNGDGKLDAEDYVYLGTDTPEIQYSFHAGVAYRGFDVSVVFQGAANRIMWNGLNNWTIPMRAIYTNTSSYTLGNVWSAENPGGYYPSYTNNSNINNYNYQTSTWSVSDGFYLRLKNVSVGYNLPADAVRRTGFLSGVRIYFTGTDLWEYTKILDGWDPEAKSSPSATSRYPFMRGYSFGVNLNF